MISHQQGLHYHQANELQGAACDTRSAAQQEYLILDQAGVNIEVLAANAPQQQIWLAQAGNCAI